MTKKNPKFLNKIEKNRVGGMNSYFRDMNDPIIPELNIFMHSCDSIHF